MLSKFLLGMSFVMAARRDRPKNRRRFLESSSSIKTRVETKRRTEPTDKNGTISLPWINALVFATASEMSSMGV